MSTELFSKLLDGVCLVLKEMNQLACNLISYDFIHSTFSVPLHFSQQTFGFVIVAKGMKSYLANACVIFYAFMSTTRKC